MGPRRLGKQPSQIDHALLSSNRGGVYEDTTKTSTTRYTQAPCGNDAAAAGIPHLVHPAAPDQRGPLGQQRLCVHPGQRPANEPRQLHRLDGEVLQKVRTCRTSTRTNSAIRWPASCILTAWTAWRSPNAWDMQRSVPPPIFIPTSSSRRTSGPASASRTSSSAPKSKMQDNKKRPFPFRLGNSLFSFAPFYVLLVAVCAKCAPNCLSSLHR